MLSFEDNVHRKRHTDYFLQTVEIKSFNVMINGRNLFENTKKKPARTFEDVKKIATAMMIQKQYNRLVSR